MPSVGSEFAGVALHGNFSARADEFDLFESFEEVRIAGRVGEESFPGIRQSANDDALFGSPFSIVNDGIGLDCPSSFGFRLNGRRRRLPLDSLRKGVCGARRDAGARLAR